MIVEPVGHFWSQTDADAVLAIVRRLQPKRVLEFGPGRSTLALLAEGARVDSCEDQPAWLDLWRERLDGHAVTFHAYEWRDPLSVPAIDGEVFDLAFIDGPFAPERRPVVIDYCLQRCAWVLVPLEENEGDGVLRPIVWALAEKHSRHIETWNTGPCAGAFALLT